MYLLVPFSFFFLFFKLYNNIANALTQSSIKLRLKLDAEHQHLKNLMKFRRYWLLRKNGEKQNIEVCWSPLVKTYDLSMGSGVLLKFI
jgi:hypothetical protein